MCPNIASEVKQIPVLNLAAAIAAPVLIYGVNEFHISYELDVQCHEDTTTPQYVAGILQLTRTDATS
jgi:hypothetical protein